MIKIRIDKWDYIQQYRFVMKMTDYDNVMLLEDQNARNIVQTFPFLKDKIYYTNDLDEDFVILKSEHRPERAKSAKDGSDYLCILNGMPVRGPFLPDFFFDIAPNGPKLYDYTFMGLMYKWRIEELGDFTKYCEVRKRNQVNKVWDKPYFDKLGSSKYALCPRGQNHWLYRPYEAIICKAIPVYTKQQYDQMPVYDHLFKGYVIGENIEYIESITEENINILKSSIHNIWDEFMDKFNG